MSDALQPTDHLALVVDYLAGLMPSVTVSSRVSTRDAMLRVELGSGGRVDHVVDRQIVIVQAWDSDSQRALDIAATALRFLLDLPRADSSGFVRQVRVVGLPVEFPDPETATPRFQASVEINSRPRRAE